MKSACAAMGLPVPALPEEPRAHSIDEARQIGAESGTCSVLDVYDVGGGCFTNEPIFVPRADDAAEGDGFLLANVYDENRKASHLVILDAQNVAAGPLATAYLDHRVPFGFHGNWKPAASV